MSQPRARAARAATAAVISFASLAATAAFAPHGADGSPIAQAAAKSASPVATGAAPAATTRHRGDESSGPQLSLFAPSGGAALTLPVDITARASDPSGVRHVRFYIDGVLRYSDASSPYRWRLDPARLTPGVRALKVVARDRAGNSRSVTRRYTVGPIVDPPAPEPTPGPGSTPEGPAPAPAPPPSSSNEDLRFDVEQSWAGVTGLGAISRSEHSPFPGRQIARDDSLVAVDDIRQGPGYAAKFTVLDGDQPGSSSGERAEIYMGGNGEGTEEEGSSGYYSLAVYFPADFNSSTWTIFHQMHGSVSGSSPALDLMVDGNRLQAIRRGGSVASPNKSTFVLEPTITRGRWHNFVYYARWSRGEDGVLKVWHRIPSLSSTWRLAVDSTGPMGYATSAGYAKPYPKIGVYRSSAESGTTVVYHGGARLRARTFAGAAGIFG